MLLSVIIPAWQEAKRMHTTVEGVARLRAALPYPVEVILVDDGSTDGTADLASAAGMKVIRRPHRGKGAAVRAGMLAANGMYRMIADADWSMCPEQALLMLPPVLHGYDVAIASRELPDSQRSGEPAWRHWIGRTYNQLVQQVVLPGILDTQCGFKVFRAEAARAIFSRTHLPARCLQRRRARLPAAASCARLAAAKSPFSRRQGSKQNRRQSKQVSCGTQSCPMLHRANGKAPCDAYTSRASRSWTSSRRRSRG